MKFVVALALTFSVGAQGAIDPLLDAEDHKQIGSEVLKAAIVSKIPSERARAAWALGHILDSRGIDSLISLAKDPDANVRAAAAFNLGQFGWKAEHGRDAELKAALVPLLTDKSEPVRVKAIEALGKTALEATPELVTPFLKDRSAFVREAATLALSRYRIVLRLRQPDKTPADLDAKYFNELLKLASDRAPRVRRAVAYYFVRSVDARGEKVLQKLSGDLDLWARFFAFSGLAKMKAAGSDKFLIRGMHDAHYNVRLAAIGAWVAAGRGPMPVVKLAKDPNFHVRAAFARGLSPKDQNALLKKMFETDKSVTVRTEALKVLVAAAPTEYLPRLALLAKSEDWQMRETAVLAAAGLPEHEREKIYIASVSDSNKNVRAAALGALGAIPTASAFAKIREFLTSSELILRGTAVGALSERKESEVLELAWSTYQASGERRWSEIRQELVGIIAKVPGVSSSKYLRAMVKDDDPGVRARALEALIERGEKDLPAPSLKSELTFSPYRDLTFTKAPILTVETTRGSFVVETYPDRAPIHVANFVGHARAGFYNGLSWHRVVSGFVIQGGDPDGSGWGDAGFSVRNEVNDIPFERGTLGMPRSSSFDSGGIQLFFNHVPTPHLDGQYTVFGKIVKGLSVLDRIERGDLIVKITVGP